MGATLGFVRDPVTPPARSRSNSLLDIKANQVKKNSISKGSSHFEDEGGFAGLKELQDLQVRLKESEKRLPQSFSATDEAEDPFNGVSIDGASECYSQEKIESSELDRMFIEKFQEASYANYQKREKMLSDEPQSLEAMRFQLEQAQQECKKKDEIIQHLTDLYEKKEQELTDLTDRVSNLKEQVQKLNRRKNRQITRLRNELIRSQEEVDGLSKLLGIESLMELFQSPEFLKAGYGGEQRKYLLFLQNCKNRSW